MELSKTNNKESFAYLNEHIQFCEKKALAIRFYDVQPDFEDFPIMAQFVFDADDMPSPHNLPKESIEDVDNTNPVSYLSLSTVGDSYDMLLKQMEHRAAATQDKKKTVVGAVASGVNSLMGRIPTLKVSGITGALINYLIYEINKAWPGFVDRSLERYAVWDRGLKNYDDNLKNTEIWNSKDFRFFNTCDGYYYLHMKFPFPKNTQQLQDDIIMTRETNKELFEHMHKYTNMLKKYKRVNDEYKQNNAIEITIYIKKTLASPELFVFNLSLLCALPHSLVP